MPPKKSTKVAAKSAKHVNGAHLPPASKTMKLPSRPSRSATQEPVMTKASKRTAEEPEPPLVNGTAPKRQKVRSSMTPPPAKRAGSQEAAKPTAKKTKAVPKAAPKTAKKKDIINYAPTKLLNVYVFGNGSSGGELGLGNGKGQFEVRRPRLNPHLSPDNVGVVQVACGGMHTAALTRDNKIFTWGVNDQGALGRDTTWDGGLRDVTEDDGSDDDSDSDSGGELNPHEAIPGEVDMSGLVEIPVFTHVACTDSATFALTEEGVVYGWGTFRSNEGVFGFSKDTFIQPRPILVDGLKKITRLACGANHVLALDNSGEVYAWGTGQQDQLGRKILERHQINSLRPQKFGLKKGMVEVGAGSYHSFAVHKSGEVYSWGLNSFGETGIPKGKSERDAADVHHPTHVKALGKYGKVTMITGGEHHSIAVTEKGECLVWGRLDGFQLGLKLDTLPDEHLIRDSHERARVLIVPTQVPGVNAVQAAAGTDHCIAITRDGKAYSWGFSLSCQTGLGTEDDVEVATLIDNTAVRGKQLVWAGAGGQFSVIAGLAENEKDMPMVNGINGHK